MKHTVRLRPGNYVHLDTYTKGVHPLYPVAAIGIIGMLVIGCILSLKMHQASSNFSSNPGTVCPTDRSDYYGPGC
jgi:hypothetical protein